MLREVYWAQCAKQDPTFESNSVEVSNPTFKVQFICIVAWAVFQDCCLLSSISDAAKQSDCEKCENSVRLAVAKVPGNETLSYGGKQY